MIEIDFKITGKDKNLILGILNQKSSKPSKKIIIWVHGLTGDINEYHIKHSTYEFVKKGFDVIRFGLYDSPAKCRKLENCTLQNHADDINSIIKQKCKEYKKVFIIGHSYGGPSVMVAQPKADAVCLWDPSFDMKNVSWNTKNREIKKLTKDFYTRHWGYTFIIGKKMIDEGRKYTAEKCLELSKKALFPILVLTAEKGSYAKLPSYSDAGNNNNKRILIKDADHCFTKEFCLNKAIKETLKWFNKF